MKKLLLDECVPHRVQHHLPGFEVYTVTFMGWSGIKNGKLLQLAVENNFDIFITTDKNLQFQQNIERFPMSIAVFNVIKDELETILLLLPQFIESSGAFEKHKIYQIG